MGAVPVPREEVGRLIPRPCQPRPQPSGDCPTPEPTQSRPWESRAGQKGFYARKALGVHRSQAGGPRHGAAGSLPLPQVEPERAKGPDLAAKKHGSKEREREGERPTGPHRSPKEEEEVLRH